jgi:hypothetical protein
MEGRPPPPPPCVKEAYIHVKRRHASRKKSVDIPKINLFKFVVSSGDLNQNILLKKCGPPFARVTHRLR